ncbi:MAG TPA: hypothetical protein VEZ11_01640, partial [Thermoanaerobaculia bacterium]|nr:hypothetical protein [Thermoanaerobaculia bacterium]
ARRAAPSRLRQFVAAARQIELERSEGAAALRLIRDTPPDDRLGLADRAELQTIGVVDAIAAEARERLDRDKPLDALGLAVLATDIGGRLAPDVYPAVILAQARANAWRERANALRFLGRYDEARSAVASAAAFLEGFGAVAHDRAVIALVEAMILRNLGQTDEALAIVGRTRQVFADHGDSKRELYCGMIEAMALFTDGRYRESRLCNEQLLAVAMASGDLESAARLHNNLALCAVELGEVSIANIHFSEAIARFNEIGMNVEAIRSQTSAGSLLLERGHVARGLAMLRDARRRFSACGMVEEAGLAGLDVVGALIVSGKADEARRLARTILNEFTVARLNRRGIEALAYLRDALDAEQTSPAAVDHVRRFIESLRIEPDREFVAM